MIRNIVLSQTAPNFQGHADDLRIPDFKIPGGNNAWLKLRVFREQEDAVALALVSL